MLMEKSWKVNKVWKHFYSCYSNLKENNIDLKKDIANVANFDAGFLSGF